LVKPSPKAIGLARFASLEKGRSANDLMQVG
jgi:hypothetical protein